YREMYENETLEFMEENMLYIMDVLLQCHVLQSFHNFLQLKKEDNDNDTSENDSETDKTKKDKCEYVSLMLMSQWLVFLTVNQFYQFSASAIKTCIHQQNLCMLLTLLERIGERKMSLEVGKIYKALFENDTENNDEAENDTTKQQQDNIDISLNSLERCMVCGAMAAVDCMPTSFCGERRQNVVDVTNDDNTNKDVNPACDLTTPHLIYRDCVTFEVITTHQKWFCPGCNGCVANRLWCQLLSQQWSENNTLEEWKQSVFAHVPWMTCPICHSLLIRLL
ncbi:hypothetical protein RFI_05043, partial [Reticulomyxa filosa]